MSERLSFSSEKITADVLDRFWAKVNKTDTCWLWTANTNRGYGQFVFKRLDPVYAHRLSWYLAYGDIPSGLLVCHKCDVPSCVNPDHLFLGTYKDNAQDRNAKGRNANISGEKNPSSKLTDAEVREIRKLWAEGTHTRKELEEVFGVGRTTIYNIVNYIRRADA